MSSIAENAPDANQGKPDAHTPEPWMVEERHGGGVIVAHVAGVLRQVALATGNAPMHDERGLDTTVIQSANARLMAAAPKMFEALREIAYLTDPDLAEPAAKASVIHARVRAALAAAEGRR